MINLLREPSTGLSSSSSLFSSRLWLMKRPPPFATRILDFYLLETLRVPPSPPPPLPGEKYFVLGKGRRGVEWHVRALGEYLEVGLPPAKMISPPFAKPLLSSSLSCLPLLHPPSTLFGKLWSLEFSGPWPPSPLCPPPHANQPLALNRAPSWLTFGFEIIRLIRGLFSITFILFFLIR